jgi:hypothetical protein
MIGPRASGDGEQTIVCSIRREMKIVQARLLRMSDSLTLAIFGRKKDDARTGSVYHAVSTPNRSGEDLTVHIGSLRIAVGVRTGAAVEQNREYKRSSNPFRCHRFVI